jgi:dihydropyrimidinase
VKSEDDMEALWKGLRDGWISTVGSDHIPMKEIGGPDIRSTEGGLPGSGTILPVLLSEGVNKGRLTIERVVEVCCTAPARTFGLSPRKGVLVPGADADVVLVDLDKRVTFHHDMIHQPVALYDGWEFRGWPVLTMLRGEVVASDGEVVGRPGVGQYVREVTA